MKTVRAQVLALMGAEPDRMFTPEDLIQRTGRGSQAVRKAISRMIRASELTHAARGWYCLPGLEAVAKPHRARNFRDRILELEVRVDELEKRFAEQADNLRRIADRAALDRGSITATGDF